MEQEAMYYGMSELSRQSSIPVSTIKFYIRKGLLPSPIKTSKTMSYYTQEHLETLKLIKKLKKERNLSLERIQEFIEGMKNSDTEIGDVLRGKLSRSREEIVEAAIDVFRQKGFAKTTISDIVNAARISKATFYSNFKNKTELFMKCFQKIFYDTHRKSWNQHDEEMELTEGLNKRFREFYKEYPKWSDMMNLLRAVAINNPKAFKSKAVEAVLLTSDEISNHVERGINLGEFRQVNTEIAGVAFLGMIDYFCYFLSQNKFKGSPEMLIDAFFDLIFNGLRPRRDLLE